MYFTVFVQSVKGYTQFLSNPYFSHPPLNVHVPGIKNTSAASLSALEVFVEMGTG
jgi:hypothetical protein